VALGNRRWRGLDESSNQYGEKRVDFRSTDANSICPMVMERQRKEARRLIDLF
jgi:hypothetical protein